MSAFSSHYVLSTWVAVALQCLRLSIDLIQVASAVTSDTKYEAHETPTTSDTQNSVKNYGSMEKTTQDEESQPLVVPDNFEREHRSDEHPSPFCNAHCCVLQTQSLCSVSFLVLAIINVNTNDDSQMKPAPSFLWWATIWTMLEAILSYRNARSHVIFSRILRWITTIFLVLAATSAGATRITMGVVIIVLVTAVYDDWYAVQQSSSSSSSSSSRQSMSNEPDSSVSSSTMSQHAIWTLLKPYVWPDATSHSALGNRIRAISTWVFLVASKACNLMAPLMVGHASTSLAHAEIAESIRYSVYYSLLIFWGVLFNEAKSVVYLRVAQDAFVQLSQAAFDHLHHLSLDWHLRKKLGEVLRGMDRGIAACDSVMRFLFMWLVPAVAECLVVTIIFASYFKYLPLALSVFSFLFAYIVWTILVTLWRKQFRKALVTSDNEWHDRFTDSMVNFETVKYFTAEKYEKARFGESVTKYQSGSVNVQASLSFLNISQQILLQSCMAMALSLTALGIQQRIQCCKESMGCESGLSDCCRAVDMSVCPGMQVGDFVAVLSYIVSLFEPLNFLGSMYNAVIMAIIDLGSLSELLGESPDVTDAPDAFALPMDPPAPVNGKEDIAVEFDNVVFHYPTQPDTRGLKGLSFKMKRGTTTAIVGPTGAGKTTISRLFFRFYDVLGGAVKVNGVDVRSVTQKSLRESIGVVPQSASMFNDTIRANLLYGKRDATQADLCQAATDAQLLDFIESLDQGWDTMVGDRGLKLSGGERQRAAIARCLLKNPPFVILDEATSALDTLTEASVQEALDRLGKHRTVLVIAHRLGTIRHAHNIVVLQDGKVAEQGTHEELLARNGLYAGMWNRQLHSTSSRASQTSFVSGE